jgi:hypothetical protein
LPVSAAHSSCARGLRGKLRFSRFSIAWVSIRTSSGYEDSQSEPVATVNSHDAA